MAFRDRLKTKKMLEIIEVCAREVAKDPKKLHKLNLESFLYVKVSTENGDKEQIVADPSSRESLLADIVGQIWECLCTTEREFTRDIETIISGIEIIKEMQTCTKNVEFQGVDKLTILQDAFSLVNDMLFKDRDSLRNAARTILDQNAGPNKQYEARNYLITIFDRYLIEGCLKIFLSGVSDSLRGKDGDPYSKRYERFRKSIKKLATEKYCGDYGYLKYVPGKMTQKGGGYYAFTFSSGNDYKKLSLERFNQNVVSSFPNPRESISEELLYDENQNVFDIKIAELAWSGLEDGLGEVGYVPIYVLVDYTAKYFIINDTVVNFSDLDHEDEDGQFQQFIQQIEENIFDSHKKNQTDGIILDIDMSVVNDMLDDNERTAVIMHHKYGNTLQEIASYLNCSIATVHGTLQQSYEKFRKYFSEKKRVRPRNNK